MPAFKPLIPKTDYSEISPPFLFKTDRLKTSRRASEGFAHVGLRRKECVSAHAGAPLMRWLPRTASANVRGASRA